MGETILNMQGIQKYFSGVHALKGVNFDLKAGEVHALMGENGAGKSTLIKVLCGIYKKDGGSIEYFGKPVEFAHIAESQNAGISVIHQELNMMNDLTVAQNIFIGREAMSGGLINDGEMERQSQQLFDHLGVKIDPSVKLGSLTVGKQQMVEIAKAISRDCKLLVLDEPTAALTQPEVEELFKIMNELRDKGIGMIYISHRMDEINRISDRVTVMRDGEYVGTVNTAEVTKDDIVKMMVGRVIMGEQKAASTCPPDADVILEVKNLRAGKEVKNVSFRLRRGEILGFAGLMGAGRTEVARALYGADARQGGEIFLNGKKVHIHTPEQAVRNGICYLSEDRKRYGLMLDKSVTENSVIACVDDFITAGLINDNRMKAESQKFNDMLRTKTPSMEQLLKNLSGGNQQKVIIARWLMRNADIFIFDEPTRGIDVGAKSEIYALMDELVKQGKSIIMISSELPEVLRMSDRVVVMCEGRVTGELDISEATQENIMQLATMREEN
ncbi:MAG: sugar ABC transporter ATP-binding protein [Oscillospiraceae bacterium]|nr:sugar ABC transporter ATP-binding protein [Oscillospiraceae bacterium]MBQ7088712.1 sugar ABC transporter ATP-binding protein [Clostridia bacterium]